METRGPYTHTRTCRRRLDACIRIHWLVYAVMVSEVMKDKFFYIKVEVWNESHIDRESFQTPIFPLYKALYDIFQKHTKILKGNHKIH